MRDDLTKTVFDLFKSNKWKDIINLRYNSDGNDTHDWSRLLWVCPEVKNLLFISDHVKRYNLKSVTSIGCGNGLFEWLLEQCTGIPVNGIEIDDGWWNSRYAPPTFIPLSFTTNNIDTIDSTTALLFCYFNNGEAFREYISHYDGNLVFVIGPGKGRGTVTNPEPFSADFGNDDWILIDYQEVMNTKDYVAVYIKN